MGRQREIGVDDEVRGAAVEVLPRDSLRGSKWNALVDHSHSSGGSFWESMRLALGARLLVRQREIGVDDEVRGAAVEVLASGGGDGWVVASGPRGVRYAFDITRCMYSDGNATEKSRVAEWNVSGETILDMYTGIGFWTLPLLAAGAAHVYACEWNPFAVEAVRRGLKLLGPEAEGRCTLLSGDNRREEVKAATSGKCDRVMLGLIPDSRGGFPNAVAALTDRGGTLHVHWNIETGREEATARAVAEELL